jgi:hypothetical protein
MHYQNGRPANNGDKILLLPALSYGGTPFVGVLFDAKADGGNDCNGTLASMVSGGQITIADLKNCLHLDDILAAAKAGRIPDSTIVTGATENKEAAS